MTGNGRKQAGSLGGLMLVVVFLGLCLVSVMVGAQPLHWDAGGLSEAAWLTLTASRLPRLAALILTGVGLASCGVILQQVVRNRFAEPATTGGLEAAKLGILVGIVLIPGAAPWIRMVCAVVFCFAASLVYVVLIRRVGVRNTVLIPVIGLMYGSVLGGIAETYAYGTNTLQSMQGWLVGDFSRIVQGSYESVYLIVPVIGLTYLHARQFTILGLGEEVATSLGLSYTAMVVFSLLLVSVTVAATVIIVGVIPFVGLVVPNLVALWRGDDLQKTLPLVAVTGASLVLLCDVMGRLVLYPYEVPIGLTAGGLGGVLFLMLILGRRGQCIGR